MAKKKKRGPRGGIKHQPGRGHQRKSGPERKRRFQQKAVARLQTEKEKSRKQWENWDKLTEEQRKLLPDFRPERPRPFHDIK